MSLQQGFRPASTLDYLSLHYGPNLTISDLSQITTQNEKTIRNGLLKGQYPIPSFRIGGKRLFRLIDVAEYLDQQYRAANKPVVRRGRPTKVQQIARAAARME